MTKAQLLEIASGLRVNSVGSGNTKAEIVAKITAVIT